MAFSLLYKIKQNIKSITGTRTLICYLVWNVSHLNTTIQDHYTKKKDGLFDEVHPENVASLVYLTLKVKKKVLFLFKTDGWIQPFCVCVLFCFICQPSWFKNNSVYGRPPGGSVRLAIKSRTAANIVHSPATEKNGH